MPRYVITVTDKDAARLEKWLGGRVIIMPAYDPGLDLLASLRTAEGLVPDDKRAVADEILEKVRPAGLAGIDAVSDAELRSVDARLRTGFAIYHAGGPA
jgi:hypothetical protein